ncbi:MAG: citrate synthase [Polyangiaceae bacterium]
MHSSAREWLSAVEASEFLGVRRETLYAYASRGQLRAQRESGKRVYALRDLEALKARSLSRRGHAAVAAAALHFGEPVLDTRVSAIGADGPRYRGQSALELGQRDVSAERVAELLWSGTLPSVEPRWPRLTRAVFGAGFRAKPATPAAAMRFTLCNWPSEAGRSWERSQAEELEPARRLLRALAAAPALGSAARLDAALNAPCLASALLESLGVRASARARAALNRALVLAADHELNASTFVARVAASAGADLARSLEAAFATLSGGRHGGACDQLEAALAGFARPEQALAWVRTALAERRALPGFGHPLYPAGDPRLAPLLADSVALAPGRKPVRALLTACDAMQLAGAEAPTFDLGLVALSAALGLPRGAAAAVFALGRALGHLAHVFEQRQQGSLLRPRAHYVGV